MRLGPDLRPPERVRRTGSPYGLLRPQRLAPRRQQRPPAVGAAGPLALTDPKFPVRGRRAAGPFFASNALGISRDLLVPKLHLGTTICQAKLGGSNVLKPSLET